MRKLLERLFEHFRSIFDTEASGRLILYAPLVGSGGRFGRRRVLLFAAAHAGVLPGVRGRLFSAASR